MSRELTQHVERAEQFYEIGQFDGAIDWLRRALTEDPDYAPAHAWLALCLIRKRRLHAAAIEANLALTLAPDSVFSIWVNAEIALAKRDFPAAGRLIDSLLAEAPENPVFYRLKARWLTLTGRYKERRAVLEEALRLDPNDPETLADLAEHCASKGELPDALRYAETALRIAPENHSALVAMGHALLRGGDVAAARDHAALALRSDPTDPGALHLLASIKMRSNPFLGAWWHYATWIEKIGPTRSVIVLLGAFVVYRIIVIAASEAGAAGLASGVQWAWLAVVAYSFIGPTLFRRSLNRELEQVNLDRF